MTGLDSDLFKERWIEYKGQQVGFITNYNTEGEEEKVYVTERRQYFKFKGRDGFSISKAILHILTQAGIKAIRILFKEDMRTAAVFVCSLDKWFKDGETNFYKALDEQLFIPLEKFDVVCK